MVDARWIPCPSSFKVITPFNPHFSLLRVGDLVAKDRGSRNVNMLNEDDRVVWHGSAKGKLRVKLAYHFIKQRSGLANPSSSSDISKKRWRQLWALSVPPRIKLFAWRCCVGAIPSTHRLGSRLPNFSMRCLVCGAMEENALHALLECPLAQEGRDKLKDDEWDVYVATIWEIWSARNKILFRRPVGDVQQEELSGRWSLPPTGIYKRVVIRDEEGDVEVASVEQGSGFLGPEIEEDRACIFAIEEAVKRGLRNVIVEGDSMTLITKLKKKVTVPTELGLLIDDILRLCSNFDFHAFFFSGGRVTADPCVVNMGTRTQAPVIRIWV
ncbi:hypothetical protein Cgig2_032318 [Carnegiea gigantea]|uniref:Reverse transcriptase zinc-binding domain-containing protein n=1 Tax=Carnegiea gigantea TaxID=171969 RepID=A0A9Q1KIR9_9CARY|nr:hypothetical protein Cgig2_032318 [Carnegiea gigantea]